MTPRGTNFKPGTELEAVYNNYKAAGERADAANDLYVNTKKSIPARKKSMQPPYAAGASHGLGNNFTVDERESFVTVFCWLAADTWHHVKDEVNGRRDFNDKYTTVWQKRTLQTDHNSELGHAKQADSRRQHAENVRAKADAHAEYVEKFGGGDVTPLSSWESRQR
ncbi:hypothetical protein K4F52_000062 [Lecanicillium sp. MT-2017a]|nr:hypothetical protein K4F52_000062 [Lecanicillium sp. MT-2017a]